MSSFAPHITEPCLDLLPEEILDITLDKMQSAGIKPVEWRTLLYRRMNVPRIVSNYSFLVPDEDLNRASDLLEDIGLPRSTPSKFSLTVGGDMQAKGRFHCLKRSAIAALDQYIVLYPLSFATLSLSELSEKPTQYSELYRCSHILVPHPSAVYASLMRMMLRYPPHSTIWSILQADIAELVLYHLMGYTLETLPSEDDDDGDAESEDEHRRIDVAISTIREWGLRKERTEWEEWMGFALSSSVRGGPLCLPPEGTS
ncbi:hypothetical protein BJV78DRAFT_1382097 [Lactifluus subvellereus]|nr:hypothetical protein BJV78DRAFT_1382097 [Lactifluus subvellereus]